MPLPDLNIAALPLVLAGPIVRRVELTSVTVWVALKTRCTVGLDVFTGDTPTQPVMTGAGPTVRLGPNLHVVAVTATGQALVPGTIYRYDLRFAGGDLPAEKKSLFEDTVVGPSGADARRLLTYAGLPGAPATAPKLPSFVTPPAKAAGLRVFHASCRKPHGEGTDSLTILHQVLCTDVASVQQRPQQLILTGDQIYADDVADLLLTLCTHRGHALVNRPETFTGVAEKDLRPGLRQEVMTGVFHMSSSEAKSHLATFEEFVGMYLLVWSDVLWPPGDVAAYKDLKKFARPDIFPFSWPDHVYGGECEQLVAFRDGLADVRRALANTPTYTMFDDHEVTDDWNIARQWCQDAVITDGAPGQQMVTNALCAYAVFQGWGNTPKRFEAGQPGRALLTQLESPTPSPAELRRLVGMPTSFTDQGALVRPAGAMEFYYAITFTSHRLIVLDTRTHRAFPRGPEDPAALVLDDADLDRMLGTKPEAGSAPEPAVDSDTLVLLLSPPPILGHPLIEGFAQPTMLKLGYGNLLKYDVEAWSHQQGAFEKLLGRLFSLATPGPDGIRRGRVVALSGDVHYGFSVSLTYDARTPYLTTRPGRAHGVLAQLVSSSQKNETGDTRGLSSSGYTKYYVIGDALPRERRLGWANSAGGDLPVGNKSTLGVDHRWTVSGSPAVEAVTGGEAVEVPADWSYDLRAHEHVRIPPRSTDQHPPDPVTVERAQALAQYVTTAANSEDYQFSGLGQRVVGSNNLGEVQVRWGDRDDKTVVHTLWWRLEGEARAAPLTRYEIPMVVAQPAPAPENLPVLYGGATLREGDVDVSSPEKVRDLLRDLQELGFELAWRRDGRFSRDVRWAVRELQTQAKEAAVAAVATGFARLTGALPAATANATATVGVRDLRGTFPAAPFRIRIGTENLTVTSANDTTWSVTRGVERTDATAHDLGDGITHLPEVHWSSALKRAEVTENQRYAGPVSGVVDEATRTVIARWKANLWRCPVVVEGWTVKSNGARNQVFAIPKNPEGRPARLADNVWRWDDTDSKPRMFARDFTRHWSFPATRSPDQPDGTPQTMVLGGPVDYTDPGALTGPTAPPDPYKALIGPIGDPQYRHCWAPEAEVLPERVVGQPLSALPARTLATFKVVRAVAEEETLGYFDAVNAYDHAFVSAGLCHWTAGTREWHALAESPRPPRDTWTVADGELWGFLAYLRSRDPAAFERMTGHAGILPSRTWTGDGKSGGDVPWDPAARKYVARALASDQDGNGRRLDGVTAASGSGTWTYGQYGEHEIFRLWHWFHRFVMAVRTDGAVQRAMWDMVRMRIRDLRAAAWNPPAGVTFSTSVPLKDGTTIGDVFRSERTVALLYRWHVYSPARLLRGSPSTASEALHKIVQNAKAIGAAATPAFTFGTDPVTWTTAHEGALAKAVLDANPCPNHTTNGDHPGKTDLGHTMRHVDSWPIWSSTSNPRGYRLPLSALASEQRQLLTTREFVLDEGGLP